MRDEERQIGIRGTFPRSLLLAKPVPPEGNEQSESGFVSSLILHPFAMAVRREERMVKSEE